jgi:hypothetical protein
MQKSGLNKGHSTGFSVYLVTESQYENYWEAAQGRKAKWTSFPNGVCIDEGQKK